MISALVRACLRAFASLLPVRRITGGDGALYLSRYTIFERLPGGRRLYLHCFHRSDEDRDLHNHPWTRSVSLVLWGGYREERRVNRLASRTAAFSLFVDDVETREVRPGALNVIDADTFHRVELRDGEAWTLFFTGRPLQRWGFWNRQTGHYTDYATYLRAKGLEVVEDDH